MTPRLFPDYAAAPTPTERAAARRANESQQLDMFGIDTPTTPNPCPACGSTEHTATDCSYHAPTMFDDEHRADDLAAMRARFDIFNTRAAARADRAAR